MYKRVHNYITPIYLNSLLVRNSESHNRATRHSNINLVCPKYKRKTEGGRTFTTRTIKDWNCMNANIRNNGSLASFKHNVFKVARLDFLWGVPPKFERQLRRRE